MGTSLYEPSESFLHGIDPTAKIIALMAWFVVALAMTHPVSLGALALLVAGIVSAAGLWPAVTRFGRFIAVFFVMCSLLWAVFSGSAGTWRAGIAVGIGLGMRLVLMFVLGILFLASTRVEDIASGLQRLGLPFMVALSLTLAFRLLPLFASSASTIAQAQACRGVDVRAGGPVTRLRRYLPLLVPLVLMGLRSADGLAVALDSRGLAMNPSRTSIQESRFGLSAAVMTVLSVGAALAAVGLRLAGAPL